MTQQVSISTKEIRLCSNLTEYSFGKTNYNSIISQEGFIFDGKNFSVWNFDEVKSFYSEEKSDRIVFYCGSNPLSENAHTLLDYFCDNSENLYKAVLLVCTALTSAAKAETKIPSIGAGGILVDISTPEGKILFLPGELFKNSVTGLSSDDYTMQNGIWLNETLTGLPSVCFERAVIIYKFLTGRFPFPSFDIVERNADILDKKFLPLELSIEGINTELSSAVNKGLKLTSSVINIPGKKQKGKSSEDLTPSPDFPLELLQEAGNLAKNISDDSRKIFENKAASYLKLQESKIAAKRKLRRNYSTVLVIFISLIILGIITVNTIKTKRSEFTSRGLTSTQTVQAFLYGVNQKDTVLLSNFSKGRQPQKFIDTVSQVYVLDKQRRAYNSGDNGFASPENWLLYSTDNIKYQNSSVYGITNVIIDGKPVELDVPLSKIEDNPEPVLQEGNITLKNGAESIHQVKYNYLHSEGESNGFIVEQCSDTYCLLYKNDKWLVTRITSESENLQVNCNKFKNDYFNQLTIENGDAVKAVQSLKNKYPWLPTSFAMTKEREFIEFKVQNPFADYGF